MNLKLKLVHFSLVAFAAFAIAPALASASPVLTKSGVALAVGSPVTGQSSNVVLTTSSGNITCQTADLAGTVTQNNGTEVKGEITSASYTGTGTSGRCTSTISDLLGGTVTAQFTVETLPHCIAVTAGAAMISHINACTAGQNLRFTLHLFSHLPGPIGTCTFESASVTTEYTTNGIAAALHATEQPFTSSSGGICPSVAKLDQDITLTTGGASTTIS